VQYRWRNAAHWTLFLLLWLLVAPLILYLVAALLYPTSDDVVVTNWPRITMRTHERSFCCSG
jgi:hypothetical protein